MTRDDIIRLAQEAGVTEWHRMDNPNSEAVLQAFAALVAAAEREKVAAWMIEHDYATGHGDTVEDLLKALEWQAKERARGFL